MKKNILFRVLSIVLSIIGLLLLGWLWMNDYKDYSFIPLFLVAVALICSNFSKSNN